MRKAKDVEEDFGDLHFLNGEDGDAVDFGFGQDASLADAAQRKRPARQRVELRNEQRSLREQLSDWDDYNEDFDTEL